MVQIKTVPPAVRIGRLHERVLASGPADGAAVLMIEYVGLIKPR